MARHRHAGPRVLQLALRLVRRYRRRAHGRADLMKSAAALLTMVVIVCAACRWVSDVLDCFDRAEHEIGG